jgi:hypothetical protein
MENLIQEERENASVDDLTKNSNAQRKRRKFGGCLSYIPLFYSNLCQGVRVMSLFKNASTVGEGITAYKDAGLGDPASQMVDLAAKTVQGQAVEEGVKGFVQGSQVLIHALDDLSKIHPFIASKSATC